MLELYENIRKYRKLNHWTQEQLASKMGYDRSMIAKIEAGKVDLSQSKILEFAKVYNVAPGDLMGSDGAIDTENMQSVKAKEFIELFQGADPAVQESVVNLLKSVQHKL